MQNLRDANQALIRWQAQLDNALSALDTIYSQVLKIKSAEVRNLSAATDRGLAEPQGPDRDLRITSDAFDQVYGGLPGIRPTPPRRPAPRRPVRLPSRAASIRTPIRRVIARAAVSDSPPVQNTVGEGQPRRGGEG